MASDLLLASPLETMESRNCISLWESLDVTGIKGMSLRLPSYNLNAPNQCDEGAPTGFTFEQRAPFSPIYPSVPGDEKSCTSHARALCAHAL